MSGTVCIVGNCYKIPWESEGSRLRDLVDRYKIERFSLEKVQHVAIAIMGVGFGIGNSTIFWGVCCFLGGAMGGILGRSYYADSASKTANLIKNAVKDIQSINAGEHDEITYIEWFDKCPKGM